MDEWDDFLNKQTSGESTEKPDETKPSEPQDLGEYVDNAEVFIQVAGGESLSQMKSGIWIEDQAPRSHKRVHLESSKKDAFMKTSSVPVANTINDLAKELVGHPRLSHPLSLLHSHVDRNGIKALLSTCLELETLPLFFYAPPKAIQVETMQAEPVNFAEIVDLKRVLLNQSLLDLPSPVSPFSPVSGGFGSDSVMQISLDNLKLLCSAIPPHGKEPFLIPFRVSQTGQVDLTADALVFDSSSTNTVSSLHRFYRQALQVASPVPASVLNTQISWIDDGFNVSLLGSRPLFNVNVAFRGALHADPQHSSIDTIFFRQPNYHVEVEAESGRVLGIKVYVPKFDPQAKVFSLLRLLGDKLSKLPPGDDYLLLHISGTPNIKILRKNSVEEPLFDANLFKF